MASTTDPQHALIETPLPAPTTPDPTTPDEPTAPHASTAPAASTAPDATPPSDEPRPTPTTTGLVLRLDAKLCHVEVDGRTLALPLRGKLFDRPSDRHQDLAPQARTKRPLAVGDRVRVSLSEDGGGAIEAVLPRTSQIARKAAGEDDREQVLAANVTLVLVVAAIVDPPLQPEHVDRVLAAAERARIAGGVVLTKVDLERGKAPVAPWVELYSRLGYRVFPISLGPSGDEPRTPEALAQLSAALHHNETLLTGPSGAGKSSLLNMIVPGLTLRTGTIGRTRQGKHTTVATQLVPLPGGGHVLDSPGVRNFVLADLQRDEVAHLFPEIRVHHGQCEYRDCTHLVELSCAVQAALARGEIAASRFASYRVLLAEASG